MDEEEEKKNVLEHTDAWCPLCAAFGFLSSLRVPTSQASGGERACRKGTFFKYGRERRSMRSMLSMRSMREQALSRAF